MPREVESLAKDTVPAGVVPSALVTVAVRNMTSPLPSVLKFEDSVTVTPVLTGAAEPTARGAVVLASA